ncbi:MAG: class SAM-dependent methyltransferase [Chloroflexi bacterium]|nr:class SAM-dependent methyltransferase [Chloroflexota bacterium]
MASSYVPENTWSEESSTQFIELGQIFTPARDEIRDCILDLMPAASDEPFLAVELGVGAGWLSEAILGRFPAARVLGLDGSPTMLRETETRLQRFTGRFEMRQFQLEDRSWHEECGADVRCFVSSLVIHHLDRAGKQLLYHDLYEQLEDGGALLIADFVAPASERERRYMARTWDAEVKRQSLAHSGSLNAYQQFVDTGWNWYDFPDPMDMPSSLPEHLNWLTEAGFAGANVFWERAGHSVFGGYKVLSNNA